MTKVCVAYQSLRLYTAMWEAIGTPQLFELFDHYQCQKLKLLVCYDGTPVCQENNDTAVYDSLSRRERAIYGMIRAKRGGYLPKFDYLKIISEF